MSIAPASGSVGTSPSTRPSTVPSLRQTADIRTLVPGADESDARFVRRLAADLCCQDKVAAMMIVYGMLGAEPRFRADLATVGPAQECPLLWVEGAPCSSREIAGVQIFLYPRGHCAGRISSGGRVVGTILDDGDARHCLLAGLAPLDVAASPGEQTRQVLEQAASLLAGAGFSYGDVARTWFYNNEILAWYNEFNSVRTAFYRRQRFACGSLPASTCVRGRSPRGAALGFAAWATIPKSRTAVVREVASPLQCPAPAYGSSFSRATEVFSGTTERLMISGTASIEPGGRTMWQGDARRQIQLTMDVIAALMGSRGFFWSDVARATAYFKDAASKPLFDAWCAERGLQELPVVPVCCDICRDDLLFELELDAIRHRV